MRAVTAQQAAISVYYTGYVGSVIFSTNTSLGASHEKACLQSFPFGGHHSSAYSGTKLPPRNLGRFIHNLVVIFNFKTTSVHSTKNIESETRRLDALLCTLISTYGTVSVAGTTNGPG